METPDTSIPLLLERVRSGDASAIGELYELYHDELLFAVRAHLGPFLRSKLESEDILQSVAVEAFRALPAVRADDHSSLKSYLHTMVVNKIRGRADYYGAASRAGDVALASLAPDAAEDALANGPSYRDPERFVRLEEALGRLPDADRRLVVLRKVDGLSSKETARQLGMSDAAVRKAYSRALARLAELVAPDGEGRGGV